MLLRKEKSNIYYSKEYNNQSIYTKLIDGKTKND